ncbi:MAG: hypothetical protein RIC07_33855 [Coleofasciculus sp. E1-EBD-02]
MLLDWQSRLDQRESPHPIPHIHTPSQANLRRDRTSTSYLTPMTNLD